MTIETITDKYCSIRLDDQFCFPLYACAKEVVRQYRKPLEKLGLTYTQYLVMMVLWEHGGMTEGELGKKVHLDSGTLAPLLKRLEKQGYLNRTRPENQENRLLLSLTEQGDALRYKATDVPREMDGCIPLSDEELIMLKNLLDKALVGMDHRAQEEL
jgi:DNA-binding MarR family transcriptional regulator